MPTNIKENGFETLIVDWLRDRNGYEDPIIGIKLRSLYQLKTVIDQKGVN